MKKTFILLLIFISVFSSNAQVVVNPQIGIPMQDLSNPDSLYDFKAQAGFMIGIDLRFGSRFYLQPGVFYCSTNTKIESDVADENAKITTNTVKLKALGGFNFIHKEGVKLRLNIGPTFDFLLSQKDDKSDYDIFKESDFNKTLFYGTAGLGIDFLFLSAELGMNYQLNEAFKSNDYTPDSKYTTFYLTVGVVFGDGINKNKR